MINLYYKSQTIFIHVTLEGKYRIVFIQRAFSNVKFLHSHCINCTHSVCLSNQIFYSFHHTFALHVFHLAYRFRTIDSQKIKYVVFESIMILTALWRLTYKNANLQQQEQGKNRNCDLPLNFRGKPCTQNTFDQNPRFPTLHLVNLFKKLLYTSWTKVCTIFTFYTR